ncbi:phosphatase PAP2 family protein [Halorhabdus sp. CUG00001]|uniref:phosphatase PAP2 family protein n=1 Tax=Halorhabdus sp. CUG00001 TaxID=2600297 RepID=UPI00131D47B8|nr:phosphatase PAP2 family protein [Halorhabdus sp. CUG00001]
MTLLLELLASVTGVTLAVVAVASLVVIGRPRLRAFLHQYRTRLRSAVPFLAVLGGVLAVNSIVRQAGMEISWMIGWNITYDIYALEGGFVPFVQSFAHPTVTRLLSLSYIYGYVFLLVFPIVAYLVLADDRWLRTAALAYSLNYVIGLGCYLLFIAYGPRNLLPDLVDPLLYSEWPSSKFLTSKVNTNTNVFPSLHTSLSVTVMFLAYRSRREYPRWVPVAAVVGTSVIVSTMYLGIHWLTDVFAGIGLGIGSVVLAERLVDRGVVKEWWEHVVISVRERLRSLRGDD